MLLWFSANLVFYADLNSPLGDKLRKDYNVSTFKNKRKYIAAFFENSWLFFFVKKYHIRLWGLGARATPVYQILVQNN